MGQDWVEGLKNLSLSRSSGLPLAFSSSVGEAPPLVSGPPGMSYGPPHVPTLSLEAPPPYVDPDLGEPNEDHYLSPA